VKRVKKIKIKQRTEKDRQLFILSTSFVKFRDTIIRNENEMKMK